VVRVSLTGRIAVQSGLMVGLLTECISSLSLSSCSCLSISTTKSFASSAEYFYQSSIMILKYLYCAVSCLSLLASAQFKNGTSNATFTNPILDVVGADP